MASGTRISAYYSRCQDCWSILNAENFWDYVALRPDVVVGNIWGNPINIALVVGGLAEISRELGIPMRFPGTDKTFGQLVQFTDSRLLARASHWAATSDRAGGETFNVTNGDTFRWERMWGDVARHLGLETASPVPLTLKLALALALALGKHMAAYAATVARTEARLEFGEKEARSVTHAPRYLRRFFV